MEKRKEIQVITRGNVVNVSINGKLHTKNCGNEQMADEFFNLALKAKHDPTDENILKVKTYLNEKLRVAMMAGLETDTDTQTVYMAGFNTPVPDTLVEIIKEYHEKNYPMEAIINFWKHLMRNPDIRVREDLFDFITAHDFVLTDNGYMVVYKAVDQVVEAGVDTDFAEFLNKQVLRVKKWQKNPNKYVVYKHLDNGELDITKRKTAEKWDEKKKNVEILGNLGDLNDAVFKAQAEQSQLSAKPVYESIYSGAEKIRQELGVPVRKDRVECDANPRQDCSNGLHVGATAYVEKFATWSASPNRRILVCYVNPAHVVAVPEYDHSKMRVCEYFPFAVADWDGEKIDIIEQAYFESDYTTIEKEELDKQIAEIQANEMPREMETAMNAEPETRPMSELLKIVESRIVDLS